MDKLIEFFETLLLYLLYPSSEERARQFELRKIWKELRYLKLGYTDIHGKKIFSSYASKLYALYKLVCTLRNTLQLPARRQELLQENDLLEYLVLQQLEPQVRRQLNSFSYDFLLERITHAADQKAAWNAVQREWTEFSRRVSELQHRKFGNDLYQLELLYWLLEFDFTSFLKVFDSNFVKDQPKQIPRFADAAADLVDQYLLDFYFLVARLRITSRVRLVLNSLINYYNDDVSEEKTASIRESLDYIELLFENELSESTLRSLIQLVRQDPEFDPEASCNTHDYIDEVHSKLSKRFESNRDRVKRELTDSSLKGRIEELLTEHSLIGLYGYTRDNEEVFNQLGLSGFLYILPLEVLKTYYQLVFSKGALGSLRRVHEDGYYESSEFQQALGEALRRFTDVSRQLEQFEAQLLNKNGVSVDSIVEMARLNGNSTKNFEVIENYVNQINRQAVKILEYAGNSAEDLHRRIGAVIGDHRASSPRFITNIRVIGGDRNRDILQRIGDSYQGLENLLKIIRSYTVIGEVQVPEQKKEKSA